MKTISGSKKRTLNLKKITWKKAKGGRAFEHIKVGYVDGDKSFIIEGRLCVTDLRGTFQYDKWESPKHYRLDSTQSHQDILKEAKEIASDLLNGLNIDKHQANWQFWEDESAKTIKILEEAQNFLNKIKNTKPEIHSQNI